MERTTIVDLVGSDLPSLETGDTFELRIDPNDIELNQTQWFHERTNDGLARTLVRDAGPIAFIVLSGLIVSGFGFFRDWKGQGPA